MKSPTDINHNEFEQWEWYVCTHPRLTEEEIDKMIGLAYDHAEINPWCKERKLHTDDHGTGIFDDNDPDYDFDCMLNEKDRNRDKNFFLTGCSIPEAREKLLKYYNKK